MEFSEVNSITINKEMTSQQQNYNGVLHVISCSVFSFSCMTKFELVTLPLRLYVCGIQTPLLCHI